MAVRKADESDRLFVVEVGMENRALEEIAKDAAFQISALFDRLILNCKTRCNPSRFTVEARKSEQIR